MNNKNNKQKDMKYYRNLINIDMVVYLIICVISMLVGLILSGDSGIALFLRCFLYSIFIVILLLNWKDQKTFIGTLSIFTSAFMIILGIIFHSMFDLIFIILGIFNIIHSIKYLIEMKKDSNLVISHEQKTSVVWLNIIALILPFVLLVLSIFLNFNNKVIVIIDLICVIFVLCSCIYSFIKKYKSTLLYVEFVFSIFLLLVLAVVTFDIFNFGFREKQAKNSEEYIISVVEKIEAGLYSDMLFLLDQDYLQTPDMLDKNYFIVTKSEYEELIKNYNLNKQDISPMQSSFSDSDLKCTGYIEVKRDLTDYNECISQQEEYSNNEQQYSTSIDWCKKMYFKKYSISPYVSCSGKYKYQTDGFDSNKLK